jgi:hypothetical protein
MFKLAVASCSKFQDQPQQPAWDAIRAQSPGALLLLGDNVKVGWRFDFKIPLQKWELP